ncbi:MAG: hypothetical protein KDD60_11850, partial [Bdellovibrionales bacterium]|nr:hypothetical protein [Bdellovibrionales bacterium]
IILVNGRLITDKMIVRAVKDGFGGTLKPNEYPQGYLDIRMPPELVDVNVHPQKLEVRFWNSSEMFRLVHRVVREAVQEFRGPAVMQQRSPQFVDGDRRGAPVSPAFRPTFTFSPTENSAPPSLSLVARTHASDEQISFDGSNAVDLGAGSINVVELEEESPKINSPKIIGEIPFQYSSLRYLGKVLGCYLVCEFEEQLILVDMHAAHERVNYNKILAKLEGIGSQMRDRLLIPIAIQFEDEDEAEVFESYITDLEGVGFQIVRDESGSFHVHEKPTWMPISHVERALRAFSAVEEGGSMREAGLLRSREQIAARLSCHASIRSGDAVSREEVYALFAALDEASWSGACPHGRPVSITFGRNDIERIFGRTK